MLLAIVTGCKERPAPAAKPVVPAGNGVVRGTVKFVGTPPPPRTLPNSGCRGGAGGANADGVPDESVVVGDAGGLANVIVSLRDGPNVASPTSDPVVLDQVGCRYVPHVAAVRTGQTLRARSSDPTMHNVHGQPAANPAFNVGTAAAGDYRDLTFAAPEIFRVKCDVHPWMAAYVGVFDHPFFAVTAADGAFELKGVPAGAYTVVAWHERYGLKERAVTVADDGKIVAVDFAYDAPTPGR